MAILLRGLEKEPKLNGREVKLALHQQKLIVLFLSQPDCLDWKVRKSTPPMFGESLPKGCGHLWMFDVTKLPIHHFFHFQFQLPFGPTYINHHLLSISYGVKWRLIFRQYVAPWKHLKTISQVSFHRDRGRWEVELKGLMPMVDLFKVVCCLQFWSILIHVAVVVGGENCQFFDRWDAGEVVLGLLLLERPSMHFGGWW